MSLNHILSLKIQSNAGIFTQKKLLMTVAVACILLHLQATFILSSQWECTHDMESKQVV